MQNQSQMNTLRQIQTKNKQAAQKVYQVEGKKLQKETSKSTSSSLEV